MNQAEIFRIAREAGYGETMAFLHGPALERFAVLIASAEKERCLERAGVALLGADISLRDRVFKAICTETSR